MEGPYFKPDSPRRTSLLEPGGRGVRLDVQGYVFGLACRPVAGVLLDFWQADTDGAYDNAGFRYRGHQFTDERGAFRLATIVPGLYPGRTRHLHVKVQAPGRPVLTTQLYFPGEPRNHTDALFDPRLLMTVQSAGGARTATFDFVLAVPQDPGPSPTPTPTGGTWARGDGVPRGRPRHVRRARPHLPAGPHRAARVGAAERARPVAGGLTTRGRGPAVGAARARHPREPGVPGPCRRGVRRPGRSGRRPRPGPPSHRRGPAPTP